MEETFIQNALKRARKKAIKVVNKNVEKIVTKINGVSDHGFPIDTNKYSVNPLKPLCTTGFKHSAFCPHGVFLCFYGCQNKKIIPL